jgi:hypothetical protein
VSAKRLPVQAAPRLTEVEGIALRFGVWFTPQLEGLPDGARCMVTAGALCDSLRAVKARQQLLRLNLGHKGEWLATSADPCLSVFIAGDALRIRIRGDKSGGRAALAGIRRSPFQDLSVGLEDCNAVRFTGGVVPLYAILNATLTEISLVPRGACPGCKLLF